MANPQWLNSRNITERIYVRGILVLDTPAQFGGTGAGGTTDMPLLYDPRTGTIPLLTGASIAGALRAYLREVEQGFEWSENPAHDSKSHAERLFGHLDDSNRNKRASVASWLVVDDALGKTPDDRPVEFRDGVTIDPATRTAEDRKKYDMELLPAGTTFDIEFELWPSASNGRWWRCCTGTTFGIEFELWLTSDERDERLRALTTALQGFQQGEIALGRRKRRGLGQCRVKGWQVARYDMRTLDGLMGWLRHDESSFGSPSDDIATLLQSSLLEDNRHTFSIRATFALEGSLLVRSYAGERDAPDMVHLRTWRDGKERPVLPGTSLAGAIRARALRIANTVYGAQDSEPPNNAGTRLVASIFGKRVSEHDREPTGSRLVVRERLVENSVIDRVQSRVKIDRFTGGSYPQALFDQMPVWGRSDSQSTLEMELQLRRSHDPTAREDARIGLLLLVLKDLWTGDLPLGGESSVGRGRLRGLHAEIQDGKQKKWTLAQQDDKLIVSDPDELERYVRAFVAWKGE